MKGMLIVDKRSQKKTVNKVVKECFSMDRPLLTRSFRKDLTKDTLTSAECLELVFILLSTAPNLTNMFTVLVEELDVQHIKTNHVIRATGNFVKIKEMFIHFKSPFIPTDNSSCVAWL